MEDRRSDKYLTVSKFEAAIKKLWYAVLIIFGFLILAILFLAYSLREESIARSDAIRVIAQQNTQLINQSNKLATQGEEAHDALCSDLDNLKVSIQRTQKLLQTDPGDIFGIPRTLILPGLADDIRQRDAYIENLGRCPSQENDNG